MTQVHLRIKDILGRAPVRGDRLWVRADAVRSTAAGEVLTPVAVAIDLEGSPTVKLEPGPARVRFELRDLAIHQNREFPVVVPTEGPITLRDLMQEAYDWTPDELSAFDQIRADATAAADRSATEADRAEAAATGVEDVINAATTVIALEVEGHRAVTEQAATDAAGSAGAAAASATAAGLSETAAAGSASAAAGSATNAAGSATAAAGSAGAADGSATAAAGSATDAGQIRDQTVAAAQIVTDNLADITDAPGHAAAAQTAREGAETARDAADGHASNAAGSAAAASASEDNADASAQAAGLSAADAETHLQGAVAAQAGAETAETAAGQSAGLAEDERVLADDAATRAATSATGAATDAGRAEAAAALAQSLRWVVRGAWVAGAYEAGDVVVWDERAYYAQAATSVQPPAQPWVPLTPAGGGGVSHWDQLDGVPTLFPPEAHGHDAVDVTGDATPALDVSDASVGALSVEERFTAAQNASLLSGALGSQVDATAALVSALGTTGGIGALLDALNAVLSPLPGQLLDLEDSKADVDAAFTALWGGIPDKPTSFPSTIALVAGLQAALEGKSGTGHTHTKAQVGLGNVDNTSDQQKPVSTAQSAAIAVKADSAFVEARPAMWLWDGTGSWSPPSAANSGDSVLNLDSGEIHSITEV